MDSPTIRYYLDAFAITPAVYKYSKESPQLVLALLRDYIAEACQEQGMEESASDEASLRIRGIVREVDAGLFGLFDIFSPRFRCSTVSVSYEIQSPTGEVTAHTYTRHEHLGKDVPTMTEEQAINASLRIIATQIAANAMQAMRGKAVADDDPVMRYFHRALPIALIASMGIVGATWLISYLRRGHLLCHGSDLLTMTGVMFTVFSIVLLAITVAVAPTAVLLCPRMLWLRAADGGKPLGSVRQVLWIVAAVFLAFGLMFSLGMIFASEGS